MTADNTPEKTLEHAPVGIYRSVPAGYFTYANPAMARLFGCDSVSDFLRHYGDIENQFYVDPEARSRVVNELRKHGYVTDFECCCYRKDGSIVWVLESARVVYDNDGFLVAYEGFFQDIDRRKAAEEGYRRAMQEAQAASQAKSDFLAAMSHELRTPLNAILGFSEILRDEYLGRHQVPAYRDYAADIHDSAEYLESLINDILDLAKIEAGRFECHCEPISLAEMVETCRRLVAGRAQRNGIRLCVTVDRPDARVMADPRRLKQALTNLLVNAIKFTNSSGTVTLRTRTGADTAAIQVADTGPGMDEDQLRRALERFSQAHDKRYRHPGGTGLGLPLAKHLIELQGGQLTLTSTPGVGTTADVRLTTA